MMRRLILVFFVLASLTSQASVAFACKMMGGTAVVMEHCCCKGMTASPGYGDSVNNKNCCQPVVHLSVGIGDQVGHLVTSVKLPSPAPQALLPILLPAVLAVALPVQPTERSWDEFGDRPLHGKDLYLRTQRLRL